MIAIGRILPAMAERVLTKRELNRALLARQLLLERVKLPIPRALERLAGIQNQYAPNAYIRLWSCLEAFERDDLTRALERGSVVQGTLMRGTIHTVSARDYRLFVAGVRAARQEWSKRIHRDDDSGRGVVVAAIRRSLSGRSCERAELQELGAGVSRAVWQTLDTDAELLRVPPSGTWERRRAHTFALADDWLPPAPTPSGDEGLEHLVKRYLAGFGPATAKDVTGFTGVQPRRLAPVLERLRLRRFRSEQGDELLDVPRAPLPDPETPAPVRFLPTWDAILLVHARRTGVIDEESRKIIFNDKMPPSFPTVLVDGRVVGTWKFEAGRIRIDRFEPIPRAVQRELRDEAERLAAFHA
jgi:winged helix DNA-binding protein